MAHTTSYDEHPMPARIMHWIHLISLALLTFTGFYIHRPFFDGFMGTARALHFVFMFVFILVAIVRVYWAFAGAGSAGAGEVGVVPDRRFFGVQRANRGQALETIKYYTFLRKTHPRTAKYNPLQKATYVTWLVLIVAQALTGFMLWTPTMGFFQPLTYLLGGLNYVRGYHYLIMWLFIITTAIHIYLSVVEAPWQLALMFRLNPDRRGETVRQPAPER